MIRAAILCQFGLLLFANRGSTQSCYSCSSCGDDPFSTVGATVVSCSSNLCYATKATATFLGLTTTVVSRGCAINGTATGCVSGDAGAGGLVSGSGTTCTCSGDKCNTETTSGSGSTSQSCYLCSNCGEDPFATSGASTVSCSSNLCYKTKATATFVGVTTTVISRGCAAARMSTGCVSGGAGLGSLVGGSGTTCTCSGEKCNTGAANVASIVAFVMSFAAALMFR